MNHQNKNVSLDHLNITVKNFEASVAWYSKVFGFELVQRGMESDGPWGILKSGDSMLCIYESPNKGNPRADETQSFHKVYHFGLRIHNRAEWESRVAEHALPLFFGGEVRYPHSTSWYVTDPSGHMIEVALWDQEQLRF